MIEKVHNTKYIIRGMKPDSVSIGFGERAKQFFLLDIFRFKKYWDSRTNKHIPEKEGKPFLWDPLFASSNEHLGMELSRRDDLEILAYFCLYFLRGGNLPWDEILKDDIREDRYPLILQKKLNQKAEDLFAGFPCKYFVEILDQFGMLLNYSRSLKFNQRPDYDWLKDIFKDLFTSLNFQVNIAFDWVALQVSSFFELMLLEKKGAGFEEEERERREGKEVERTDGYYSG